MIVDFQAKGRESRSNENLLCSESSHPSQGTRVENPLSNMLVVFTPLNSSVRIIGRLISQELGSSLRGFTVF